jgi:hypothetical protein
MPSSARYRTFWDADTIDMSLLCGLDSSSVLESGPVEVDEELRIARLRACSSSIRENWSTGWMGDALHLTNTQRSYG